MPYGRMSTICGQNQSGNLIGVFNMPKSVKRTGGEGGGESCKRQEHGKSEKGIHVPRNSGHWRG